jgi:hypothetical protein
VTIVLATLLGASLALGLAFWLVRRSEFASRSPMLALVTLGVCAAIAWAAAYRVLNQRALRLIPPCMSYEQPRRR